MIATDANVKNHQVVSQEEWLEARKAHLMREKSKMRELDDLYKERRALPWVKVEKRYQFEDPNGSYDLSALFGDRSQLIVYHFMFAPGWTEGCTGCSFISDHIDGANLHLAHHDVSVVAVSRAPYADFMPFKKRMGWKFWWLSSAKSDFNFDFNVSFTEEQLQSGKAIYNYEPMPFKEEDMHGTSVFYKDPAGTIFHTYSTYGRGDDVLMGAHRFLDLTPKGRNESETMNWVKHHDKYEESEKAPGSCGCGAKE